MPMARSHFTNKWHVGRLPEAAIREVDTRRLDDLRHVDFSGRGHVSNRIAPCEPPVSAQRIFRPSIIRNCGWIDAVGKVFMTAHARRGLGYPGGVRSSHRSSAATWSLSSSANAEARRRSSSLVAPAATER
jgi:hypothetical protein